jgi:hypothetical protein
MDCADSFRSRRVYFLSCFRCRGRDGTGLIRCGFIFHFIEEIKRRCSSTGKKSEYIYPVLFAENRVLLSDCFPGKFLFFISAGQLQYLSNASRALAWLSSDAF